MTDSFVKEQIRIIEEATKAALQSKEMALRFLQDAVILKREDNKKQPASIHSSKKD